jgi:hypothetical protein
MKRRVIERVLAFSMICAFATGTFIKHFSGENLWLLGHRFFHRCIMTPNNASKRL